MISGRSRLGSPIKKLTLKSKVKVEMRAIKCHINIGIKDEVHRRDSGDTEEEVVILYSGKKKEPGILLRGGYV